jgi:hypothetical protein
MGEVMGFSGGDRRAQIAKDSEMDVGKPLAVLSLALIVCAVIMVILVFAHPLL